MSSLSIAIFVVVVLFSLPVAYRFVSVYIVDKHTSIIVTSFQLFR